MFATALDRNWRAISSPRGFVLFIAGFITLVLVLRYALFPGASSDDAEMLVLAQSFEGLYKPGQPPLLNWILATVFAAVGPSLGVLVLVKALIVLATYLFLYGSARILLADPRRAALAAASPLLIYLVAWDGLFNYSHTVSMTAVASATLWAMLRLRRRGGLAEYLLLGLLLGLGVQTKYNFAIFAAGLLAAGFADGVLRQRLAKPGSLLSVLAASLLAAPHFLWLFVNREAVTQAFDAAFRDTGDSSWLGGVLSGLGALGDGVIGFLLPLPIILIALFPQVLRPVRGVESERRWADRFLLIHMAVMLAMLIGSVLFGGVSHFRNHYFFVFIVFPLWFFARLELVAVKEIACKRYAAVLSICALGIALGVVGKFFAEPHGCKRCYLHIPYPEVAAQIREAGFSHGTVIMRGQFVQIGGNLWIEFPEARIITQKFRYSYVPPLRRGDGQCLFVWTEKVPPDDVQNLKTYARVEHGVVVPADAPVREASAPFRMAPDRIYRLFYILLPEGSGTCR
ncbi:MAG: glycosyltransferase family 39 protein [Alphaproteobacteria bacterium]|nr:glycosyltransferase family 39 protein [Alphaproteobacteria bacterium]